MLQLSYENELRAVGRVDRASRTIRGYVVAQAGPFKSGRGEFDRKSLEAIVRLGNELSRGLVSRITHPESDATGKLLGRARRFRLQHIQTHGGDSVWAAVADLKLSEAASRSPDGDWPEYLMSLIEEDAASVSTSLVLDVDLERRRGLPPLWRPTALHATDIVDVGDAVDSVLAAAYLAKPKTAQQKRQRDMVLGGPVRLAAKPNLQPQSTTRPVIVGYPLVFNEPDIDGTATKPAQLSASVLKANEIRCLVAHDFGLQFGTTADGSLSLSIDDYGLRCEIFPLRYQYASQGNLLLDCMLRGGLGKMSFGYGVDKSGVIRRIDEVSLLSNPKGPKTVAKLFDDPHRLSDPRNRNRNEYLRARLNFEAWRVLPPSGIAGLGPYATRHRVAAL